METILGQWWNNAAMISELVSSFSLVLFVSFSNIFIKRLRFKSIILSKIIGPILYGMAGTISIYLGFYFGSFIDPKTVTSFMSMPFTLIKSIYYNTFNILISSILVQTIGSLLGVFIYLKLSKLLIKKSTKKEIALDGLIISHDVSRRFGIKEFIAQLLLISILLFVSTDIDFGFSSKGNLYFSIFLIGILLVIEFYIFQKWFFFMLSPQLIFSHIIVGYLYGIISMNNLKSFLIQFTIQLSAVCIVSYTEFILRVN